MAGSGISQGHLGLTLQTGWTGVECPNLLLPPPCLSAADGKARCSVLHGVPESRFLQAKQEEFLSELIFCQSSLT